jgi:hypothetical protein
MKIDNLGHFNDISELCATLDGDAIMKVFRGRHTLIDIYWDGDLKKWCISPTLCRDFVIETDGDHFEAIEFCRNNNLNVRSV